MARHSFLSDDDEELMIYVGLCITEWATIDKILYRLCHHSLGCSTKMASIVYYRVNTLDGRIGLPDELVRAKLPMRERINGGHDDEITAQWKGVVTEIRDLLQFRNKLAHWPRVTIRGMNKPIIHYSVGEFFRDAVKIGKSRPISAERMIRHYEALQQAILNVTVFYQAFQHLERPAKSVPRQSPQS
jgi:hypothetical protein